VLKSALNGITVVNPLGVGKLRGEHIHLAHQFLDGVQLGVAPQSFKLRSVPARRAPHSHESANQFVSLGQFMTCILGTKPSPCSRDSSATLAETKGLPVADHLLVARLLKQDFDGAAISGAIFFRCRGRSGGMLVGKPDMVTSLKSSNVTPTLPSRPSHRERPCF